MAKWAGFFLSEHTTALHKVNWPQSAHGSSNLLNRSGLLEQAFQQQTTISGSALQRGITLQPTGDSHPYLLRASSQSDGHYHRLPRRLIIFIESEETAYETLFRLNTNYNFDLFFENYQFEMDLQVGSYFYAPRLFRRRYSPLYGSRPAETTSSSPHQKSGSSRPLFLFCSYTLPNHPWPVFTLIQDITYKDRSLQTEKKDSLIWEAILLIYGIHYSPMSDWIHLRLCRFLYVFTSSRTL